MSNKKRIIIAISSIILFIALLVVISIAFNKYKVDVYENIKYGEHERNVFDLYLPASYEKHGLILYIHGGAWIAGDKESYKSDMQHYAEKEGIACAAINYRYASADTSCYDILDDIDAAVTKIKETAKEHGVELEKMMLTGHSAGAHLSLLYAYKYQNIAAIKPVCVASLAGPTDLTDDLYYQNWPTVYELFSYMIGKNFDENNKEEVKQDLLNVSPITYVNQNSVPTIIAQGEQDTIVSKENAITLENVLKDNNVEYYAYYYPHSGHGLEKDRGMNKQFKDKFNEFIVKYLG